MTQTPSTDDLLAMLRGASVPDATAGPDAPDSASADDSDGAYVDDPDMDAWMAALVADDPGDGDDYAPDSDEPSRGGEGSWRTGASSSPRPSGGAWPDGTRGEVPAALLDRLNEQQAAAVTHGAGPLLVVAGPGSGKTRVLTHRIAGLVARGCPPWRICAVTFTNKAAGEMRERLAVLLGEEQVSRMWVGTFHAICARILRTYHAEAGLPRAFTIAAADEARRLIGQAAKDLGVPAEADEVKSLASRISRAKNAGMTVTDAHERSRTPGDDWAVTAAVWARYDAALAALGAVDFDDMLTRTAYVLSLPEAAARYAARFAHVLVDEWQDTNAVQFSIAQGLSAGGSIVAVGDARQAIYAFRGASAAAMEAFTDAYPHASTVVLGQNYRSTPQIVSVCQSILAGAPEAASELWTTNPAGALVSVHEAADDRAEARWIVQRISTHLRAGGTMADHAVLVRSAAQTRVLEQALRDARLPYVLVGGLRFFDRAEVRDAVAWLRLAANPADAMAFTRAVSTPRRGVGEATVNALVAAAHAIGQPILSVARAAAEGSPLPDGSVLPARQRAGLVSFVAAVDSTRLEAQQSGPGAAARYVVDRTGLSDHHAAGKDGAGVERVANLAELVASAEQFEADDQAAGLVDVTAEGEIAVEQPDALEGFLEHVALYAAQTDADGAPADDAAAASAVAVMTAHASKGREFAHVYVAGVEDGYFPHSRSTSESEVAEERRLLFVACSRAMRTLAIVHARNRWAYGRAVDTAVSPFLDDLPGEAIEFTADPDAPVIRTYGAGGTPGWRGTSGSGGHRAGGGASLSSQYPSRPGGRAVASPSPAARSATPTRPLGMRPAPASAAPSGPRLDVASVHPGAQVEHATLGIGDVLGIDGTVVTVRFADGRVREMDASRAPMQLSAGS